MAGNFLGFVSLGSNLTGLLVTKNGSGTPADAVSAPTFRVYGPTGLMTNGTGTAALFSTPSITDATNASPIVITSATHGLNTGTRVTVASVGGNTAANGDWQITNVSANTFSLDGSTGNGAYTSGGAWHVTGLYSFTVAATGANGYESGKTYFVLLTFTVGATVKSELLSFTVV